MKESLHILPPNERTKVHDKWAGHPLFDVCESVFSEREARLQGAQIAPEDIFYAVATLLDELWNNDDLTQRNIDRFWTTLYMVIRTSKPDATEHDKRQVAHTVFAITLKALCHHWRTLYCETYFTMMRNTIDAEMQNADKKERMHFRELLIEESNSLDDWINNVYDGHLSEEIDKLINTKSGDNIKSTIFHDNLYEEKIATALRSVNRLGMGPKQFAKTAQEFFQSIGWLVNTIDTQFVSWLKKYQIIEIAAEYLQHVKDHKNKDELEKSLRNTFQKLNKIGEWEDKREFYKRDDCYRINDGRKR